jgi:hypothetical protein
MPSLFALTTLPGPHMRRQPWLSSRWTRPMDPCTEVASALELAHPAAPPLRKFASSSSQAITTPAPVQLREAPPPGLLPLPARFTCISATLALGTKVGSLGPRARRTVASIFTITCTTPLRAPPASHALLACPVSGRRSHTIPLV